MDEVKNWYEGPVNLAEAESYIGANMFSAVRAYVANGYWLRRIRDGKLFLEEGYQNFDEYVRAKYSSDKGWASRCIKVNRELSAGGDSPVLDGKYSDYSLSQLIELAGMTGEQRDQASPDQTVRELRELRKPKEIPYIEIPGQGSFEADFPEIFPDFQEPEAAGKLEPVVCTMGMDELLGTDGEKEKVVTSQLLDTSAGQGRPGMCAHRDGFPCSLAEQDKQVPGTGGDCAHECCWGCVKHGSCRLECYASAQRPEGAAETQQDEPERCGNRSEPEEGLSAYGTPKRVYPPGSLLSTPGCDGGHDCFSCAMDCGIREEDRYCREAPLGNPFPCEHIVLGLQNLQEEIGDRCQFVNHELADHCAGSGKAAPCCKNCSDPCEYICERAMRVLNGQQEADGAEGPETEARQELETEPDAVNAEYTELEKEKHGNGRPKEYDRQILEGLIADVVNALEVMQEYWIEKQPHTYTKYAMQLRAYKNLLMTDGQEAKESDVAEQLELPVMRNNDQRKEFLNTFHDWPVWFKVPEASEVYYRYDLPDRTALVICEYQYYAHWMEKYGDMDPDRTGTREYLLAPGYHYLEDCKTNRSAMIEKLKEIQKKG